MDSKPTHSKVDQAIKGGIVLLLVSLAGVIVWTVQEHIVDVGDSAPNFTIRTATGQPISPHNFGGKALILNFWASWCSPCVQEAPSLNELAKTLAPSGLVVLGISVDSKENLYQAFVKHFDLAFPVAWDPEENINNRYGTYKFPESYIIDRNGKVVRKYLGLPDRDGHAIEWTDPELVGFVRSLL